MPGLHKHKGGDSYYLVPKRHGDFHTYQLEDEARDMVLATGKQDGDIVSWDIFYTLNDLGLLYFKESDADPRDTAPDPSAVDFDIVSELSAEKRCAFVNGVLDHYALHEVDSDAFHRVVVSLSEASSSDVDPVLETILDNTPVPTDELSPISFLFNGGHEFPANRIETAALLHHIYNALWNGDGVPGLLDGYDGEQVYVDGDYAYYLLSEQMWDSEDKTSVIHIDLPDAYTASFQNDEYAHQDLLDLVETILEATWKSTAERNDSRLLETLYDGLANGSDSTVLIVPTASVEQSDTDTLQQIVDSFDDSLDELEDDIAES